jgi:alginate O-acetyltransferase complex protein AlgJ
MKPASTSLLADRALVLLFLLVISLPLAANLVGFDGGDQQAENRELAAMPTIAGTLKSVGEFPIGLAHWFDDHFGFRATLVRWYGESRLFGLGVSPSTAVVLGRGGWLFYGDDGGMQDYTNEQPLSNAELDLWHDSIVRANDWLTRRGVAYIFTIVPDKHIIYPEQVPASIRQVNDISRTDQVFDALAESAVAAIDVRPALRLGKSQERLYHLTDTHWNDRGALIAYQQIIGAVRAQVPAVLPAWTRADFNPVERSVNGMDLAGMMGLTRVLREVDLQLVPRRQRLARVIEPAGAEASDELGRVVTEIPGSALPRAVVFRDSFASALAPFLSEHFSRVVYLWQNDFDAEVVQKEYPDVVIQEIVARHLYTFIPSPELVPH